MNLPMDSSPRYLGTLIEFLDEGRLKPGLVVHEQANHVTVAEAAGRERSVARDLIMVRHPELARRLLLPHQRLLTRQRPLPNQRLLHPRRRRFHQLLHRFQFQRPRLLQSQHRCLG